MILDQAVTQFKTDFKALADTAFDDSAHHKIRQAKRVYLLGPTSFLGASFALVIAQKMTDMGIDILFVDDVLAEKGQQFGTWDVLSTQGFVLQAQQYSDVLSVNMGNSLFASGYLSQASRRAGVDELDIIPVLDFFELPVIYQTANTMRSSTIKRMEDYFALAERLTDPLSIQTLSAMVKLRLTLDRKSLLPILCSLENEYFAPFSAGSVDTFKLGEEETLVDVGAHVGTTIGKFLAATHWKYSAIHAFEPDTENYSTLKNYFVGLPNLHAHNLALSDVHSTMQFAQTGTMGSRIDIEGNVKIQAVPLDEIVDYATFIKMDVEGHETNVMRGARKLIGTHHPRLAITGYHYADDLLDIVQLLLEIEPRYQLRLRHHSYYYYDSILYAEVRL